MFNLSVFLGGPIVDNKSPPNDAFKHQRTGSSLVQVMAWYLFGAKPLPEPMLIYGKLGTKGQTSVKFVSKYKSFLS